MCERKPWTQKEDQTLKLLKQARKISRWSQISRIMKEQFQIFGRNGKQCRERYHNHLDSRISKKKWELQQEKKLLDLHNQWGNRWAAISRQLPGRTDNCVKNHFYSYFRKCIKGLNNIISHQCQKKIRPVKLGIINKVISIIESFHKDSQNFDKNMYQQAKKIKIEILRYTENSKISSQQQIKSIEELVKNIAQLNKTSRNKIFKKKKFRFEEDFSHDINIENYHYEQNCENVKMGKKKLITNKNESQNIKIEALEPPKQQQVVKRQQNLLNHPHPYLEMTPLKQKKQDKERYSSYYALNSVDYLDAKNYVVHDIQDFIYMDDDKEWKLQFE